jgi:hypothetical protein
MNQLQILAKKLKNVKINKLASQIFNIQDVNDWILDSIKNRLEYEGKDAKEKILQTDFGKSAGKLSGKNKRYGRNTEIIKRSKGQDITKVTLKDSGDFYKSFRLLVRASFFEIKANFKKKKGNIYKNFLDSYNDFETFEREILNITDKDYNVLIDNFLIPHSKQIILNNVQL